MGRYDYDDNDLNGPDAMPTPCADCGRTFDLNDGKPCRTCRTVFCPRCARHTGNGWRCYTCEPAARPDQAKAGRGKR